jgi:hypothetical protein
MGRLEGLADGWRYFDMSFPTLQTWGRFEPHRRGMGRGGFWMPFGGRGEVFFSRDLTACCHHEYAFVHMSNGRGARGFGAGVYRGVSGAIILGVVIVIDRMRDCVSGDFFNC